jgi:hypothetical protein
MIRIENATKELMKGLTEFFKLYPSDVKAEEVFPDLYDITISNEVPVIIKHNIRTSDTITLDLGCHYFEVPKADMYRFSII